MRRKKILINTIYSILSAVIMSLMSLITRSFFLHYFGASLLGYESLFANIFSLLSLSDLGINSVIVYALYKEVAEDNKTEIAKLMNLYRVFYQIVGCFVVSVGVLLLFFIPQLVKDGDYDRIYVYSVYVMQLISAVSTYFLAYRRILFTVDQKDHVCVRIETKVNIISTILKILAIVVFKDLFIYLFAGILNNILANVMISISYGRTYPYAVKKVKLDRSYLRGRNFFSDIGNNLVCKIAETIYSSTDSIIISIFIGINAVGLYTNYMILDSYTTGIYIKLFKPIQAAVGNYVNCETINDRRRMLEMLDLMGFLIATFTACGYMIFIQSFIDLWIGKEYELPWLFVFFISINCYIRWNYYFTYMFRNTWGHFELDRNYFIMSAVSNIVVSVILQQYIGISGIMLGTIIGQIFFWIGRSKVVHEQIIKTQFSTYIKAQIRQALLFLLELMVCYHITRSLKVTIIGLILRAIICITFPFSVNMLFYHKTETYIRLIEYLRYKILPMIKKRGG